MKNLTKLKAMLLSLLMLLGIIAPITAGFFSLFFILKNVY